MGSSNWDRLRARNAARRAARAEFRKLDRRFVLEDLEPRWLLTITGTGIPAVFTEGDGTTSSLLATFTDTTPAGAASDYAVTINWGDGGPTSAGTVSQAGSTYFITASHAYAEQTPGTSPNQVSISIVNSTNLSDTGAANTTAAVADAALNPVAVTFSPIETLSFNGTVASFTDNDPNGTASDYVASIDWGDGTTTAGTVSGSGTFDVAGTHTYAEDGSYAVKVQVIDQSVPGAPSSLVTVNSVAQVQEGSFVLSSIAPLNGTEGTAFSGITVATFNDPGSPDAASDYTATVDWGDGTTDTGTITGSGGNFTVTDSHTYNDEGSFTCLVTVSEPSARFTIGPVPASVSISEGDSLSGTPTTISATEGTAFSGTVATFSDTLTTTPASDFTATIDWGDGTTDTGVSVTGSNGQFTVAGTHTYGDEYAVLPVIVTISDDSPGTATASATSLVSVGEGDSLSGTALTLTASEGQPFSGTVATFSDTLTTTPASDFTATIDWGDGTTDTGVSVTGSNGQFSVAGTHTYAEDGTYSPVVTIADDSPGTATASATSTMNVLEDDLSATAAGNVSNLPEGQAENGYVAKFTDPGATASEFTATIDWGDGSTTAGVSVTQSGGTFYVTDSHTFVEEGSYTVTTTIYETGVSPSPAATVSFTAGVVDSDAFSGTNVTFTGTEGQTFSGTVANFLDTGYPNNPGSDFSASIDWGDGTTTAGSVTQTGNAFTVSGSHTYGDEYNSLPVIVTLSEDSPGTASASVTSSAYIDEGDSFTGSAATFTATEGTAFNGNVATFSDTLTTTAASDFTATIDWGDGTTDAGVSVTGSAGQFTVAGTHTYAQDGTYYPVVTILDDTPGTATYNVTGTATVAEDPLSFSTTGLSFNATEGTAFNGTVANFSDPGTDPASNYTAAIDWGDGTTTDVGTVAGSNGNYTVGGSHVYADEGQYNVTVTINEPDVSFTTTASALGNVFEGDTLTATPVTASATEGQSFSGTVATFVDTGYAGNTPSDFTATINWGDGTTDTGTIIGTFIPGTTSTPAALQLSVSGTHTYWGDGSYYPVVTLSDDSPSTLSLAANSEIDVAETPNELSVSGTSLTGGILLPLSNVTVATFTDVNAKTDSGNPATPTDYMASIDWGDGTTTAGTVGTANGGYDVTGTHTYRNPGDYTLHVNVEEADEPTDVYSASSFAHIIAGTITPSPVNFSPTEGRLYQGPVATFTDNEPGIAASNFSASIEWADGTVSQGTISGPVNGPFTVSGSHVYADERGLTPTIKIQGLGAAPVHVNDQIQVQEGDVLTPNGLTIQPTRGVPFSGAVATFSDTYLANTGADFTATIAWGDGAVTQGVVSGGNGTLMVSGTHTYASARTYKIKVTINDDPNGTAVSSAFSTAVVGVAGPLVRHNLVNQNPPGPAAVVNHPSSSHPHWVHDLALARLWFEEHRHRHK